MELSLSSNEPDEVETNCSASSPTVATGGSNSSHLRSADLTPNKDESIWLCALLVMGEQDMIGCDRRDGWFHFECVGIEEPPPERQKWYCLDCASQSRWSDVGPGYDLKLQAAVELG